MRGGQTAAPSRAPGYLEMYDAQGQPRPPWQALAAYLQTLSPARIQQQQAFIRAQIRDHGVSCNLETSLPGEPRRWDLDPLPWLLAGEEWERLSQGVIQRATLLDRVLADLYGQQQLLQQGLLPPALVYGHPDYLWPCQGLQPVGGRFLHLYAVDLIRSCDGSWRVLSDRSQAPSGAGYALQNRLLLSRTQPELLAQYQPRPLADFFRTLRHQLSAQAPTDGESPLLVLLTPGSYHPSYVEHASLARYLGFPLVEGQDLTVRAEKVYLKTLTGLQRVHGIVRRIQDGYCDPLELRGDSALGVPGLLQAVRAGQVLLANAPGSGVVEAAGFKPFLPAICQQLLGCRLLLEDVPSWWCGEPQALQHVLQHLDRMVVRPAYPSASHVPEWPTELSAEARRLLIDSLRRQPHAYVAEEAMARSLAPTVNARGELELRPISLRLYAVASADGGYVVMPGGLVRVAGMGQSMTARMHDSVSSKDVWVEAGAGDPPAEPSPPALMLQRSPSYLSSRMVENLFWFGRYTARCNDMARLLRVALARFDDASDQAPWAQAAALDICQALGLIPAGDPVASHGGGLQALSAAVHDLEMPESLAGNIRRLGWTALQIRERLSQDNWKVLQQMQQALAPGMAPARELPQLLDYLDRSLLFCAGLTGFAMDGMTRDPGWRLLMVGRHLERLGFVATAIARFLRRGVDFGWGTMDWMLEVTDSMVTYRSRYRSHAQLLPLIDLVVLDADNPGSVRFQLQQLREHLGALAAALGPGEEGALPLAELERQAQALDGFLSPAPSALPDSRWLELAEQLEAAVLMAWRLSDQLAMRHFTHVSEASLQTLAA